MIISFSCKKEIAKDPEFKAGDYPRIFYLGDRFPASVIINENDTARITILNFLRPEK